MKCGKIMALCAFLFIAGCAGAKDDIRAICDDPLTEPVARLCEEYLNDG